MRARRELRTARRNLFAAIEAELVLEEARRGSPFPTQERTRVLAIRAEAVISAWVLKRELKKFESFIRGDRRGHILLDPNPG